ncbi:MAG: rod shape-determining protein MreD [Novosphingobium sp.]|uniref:rod shape-determining protein MreD n=1 Tax=Novosphingobium sp. TaxID=1874826 RepID=UPI0032BCB113
MAPPLPPGLRGFGKQRINRAPSSLLAMALPWIVVMLGSLTPLWPMIASAPVMPPLGFLFLVAWQQMRPGLFPVWAGLPLGLFDDLYSGQPFGSAVTLWSIAMLVLDFVELRFPWRGIALTWVAASAVIGLYLLLAHFIVGLGTGGIDPGILIPQFGLSILAYPIVARLVGLADRMRLIPIQAA